MPGSWNSPAILCVNRRKCPAISSISKTVSPLRDVLGEQLSDDAMAWQEALRVTREIEDTLAQGETWRLEVRRDVVVFRIEIKTEKLA